MVRGIGSYRKYHNRPVEYDNIQFDSQAECIRYQQLVQMQNDLEIMSLTTHPRFELQSSFRDKNGIYHRSIVYEADFSYFTVGSDILIAEDVKGKRTPAFSIKEKLFRFKYRDIELVILPAVQFVGGR